MVITSTMPHLLERAAADQTRYGGQFLMAKPFEVEVLLAAICDLLGASIPGQHTD